MLFHCTYVNSQGNVVERFLALVHVTNTTSDALKEALFGILDRHKLSVSRTREQGYDGASNMRGEFNGLQKRILDENPYVFYVHCVAHQLQLVVCTANGCSSVHDFFEYVSIIVTTTSESCKRRDALLLLLRLVFTPLFQNACPLLCSLVGLELLLAITADISVLPFPELCSFSTEDVRIAVEFSATF